MKNSLDPELVGNLIGNQVEEENKKYIDSGQTKEYKTEEYGNPAYNDALELRKSDEDDKREVQKETAKLDDNTGESQSTQTSEPGIFSSIASIFRSFISWIWGTEEESESIELSQSSLYSDPLSDESHYSQSDTNNIL